jgi:hypothetical protein
MINMAGKLPGKSSDDKRKKMSAAITTVVVVAPADTKEIMDTEVTDEDSADEAEEIITTTII